MSDPIVYGFARSTFVNIVRLVLTHRDVPYTFQDLETVMGKPEHLALKQAGFFARTAVVPGAPHYWLSDPIDEPCSFSGFLAPRLVRFLAERL